MRFEDLDKKIKEAADQHHPAYDEKAWHKMEKLLNEHLPQPKNDGRRIIFFLLFFLLIGGGAFIIISKHWEKNSKTAYQPVQENKNLNPPHEQSKNAGISKVESKTDKASNKETRNETSVDINSSTEINILSRNDKTLITKISKHTTSNQPQFIRGQKAKDNNNVSLTPNNNNKNDVPVVENGKKLVPDNSREAGSKLNQETEDVTKINKNNESKEEIKQLNESANQEIAKAETKKATPKKKGGSGNRNGFGFSVSAGPDVSKAGSSKTGKTTLVYGAGIGYTRNRFALRTGIYAVKKIYWADPDYYKLNYTPPPTVKFEGADADCYVIEIPIKLSYDFGFRNKSNWFAGAGLSSYLMKREKYVYTYKPVAGGSPYYHSYETKNENKHYFSVFNLSGGYTYNLNNRFSISAEPYVEIPLTGIGAGKVHLNSGGILFTLGVKPFKK
jgi:hypothetical protein